MSKFLELRKLNVGEHIEKKNGLSYLSWSWAVDVLLQNDPNATWEFPEPKQYGETMMVYCDVTAFGKTMKMHLPVMDYKNQAVKNPSSVDINKAMMRCLAKCIACFGIGLYVYSGEDIPSETMDVTDTAPHIQAIENSATMEDLKANFAHAYGAFKKNPVALAEVQKVYEQCKTKFMEVKND